jgi:hypothetical protein
LRTPFIEKTNWYGAFQQCGQTGDASRDTNM